MGASNDWKCQQEKGIADERELMQLPQHQHSVASRRGRSGRCLFQVASSPTSGLKASKKQGLQRDKQQHSKQRCIW